jgi:hypothetical protein
MKPTWQSIIDRLTPGGRDLLLRNTLRTRKRYIPFGSGKARRSIPRTEVLDYLRSISDVTVTIGNVTDQ